MTTVRAIDSNDVNALDSWVQFLCAVSFICAYVCLFLFSFFFFQAEDGIRDGRVTGVQTCALPIFGSMRTISFPFGTATQSAPPVAVRLMCSAQQTWVGPTRIVATTRFVAGSMRDRKSVV